MVGKLPGKIIKLDQDVVNRIAAGEVVQRPANAIKELLENSLDAGAKSIQIAIKNGGLKVLQIQDDGTGIRKEDLPILCERFTTSKLEKFEDLETIGTYGFRGEALASISHVSLLTITTKTEESQCAFQAKYVDGALKVSTDGTQNPKAVAGNQGTIILAEDLFYNMDTRRRALKPADEQNKILSVVTQYSVHNPRIGFIVRKHGETGVDLRTPKDSSAIDNIKILYGGQISRELLEVNHDDDLFKLRGYVSNVNYSTKKCISILFINHRLVESAAMRRAIDSVYSSYLPKSAHPFLYLSLEINPRNVDVNVHPTKNEVHFLHEDIINSKIASHLESLLLGCGQSRAFYVQSLLPISEQSSTSQRPATSISMKEASSQRRIVTKSFFSEQSNTAANDPRKMVRTDNKTQKLDKFFSSTPVAQLGADDGSSKSPWSISSVNDESASTKRSENVLILSQTSQSTKVLSPKKRDLRLRSICLLNQKIKDDHHQVLLQVFRNLTFVGCVDRTRAIIQHETKMYLLHTTKISVEFFYQRILAEFGNFGRIAVKKPRILKDLIRDQLSLDCDPPGSADELEMETKANRMQQFLLDKAQMLNDYFGIKINDSGVLLTLPILLDKYLPDMQNLSRYLLNLVEKVNWTGEQQCFESFAHHTALFYAIPPGDDDANDSENLTGQTWKWIIEHIFYPDVRKSLLPPKTFAGDSTVLELADLPSLYKVFERC